MFFPVPCTPSITDLDEETDICQTPNLTKKKGKTRKPIVLCISPLEERRAGPSNRGNSQVGRDRPAVDM